MALASRVLGLKHPHPVSGAASLRSGAEQDGPVLVQKMCPNQQVDLLSLSTSEGESDEESLSNLKRVGIFGQIVCLLL